MFLKRLEVTGFKSFADKTTIEFVPGVTAVVGPNGSGKSNITEAIRWVLGEQSAKSLRGSKMEDIIFSGSDARKAVNMAEVTLTLDNGDRYLPIDYSEISVTRRVFRSGESEFLLNKQNCRLKDIVDLFMDSGLGKEAYSVIGQGKIDEILNSRAEDKRKIFEEAAGVLKYKLRKQVAEKKLAESQGDLDRVEDILRELNDRLGPLKTQASVAQAYLAKKEALEQIDIALLAHDIADLHTEWENAKHRLQVLVEKKAKQSARLAEKEKQRAVLRQALERLDATIDRGQTELAGAGEQLEKMIGQQGVVAERRKNAQNSAHELSDRLQALTARNVEERQTLKRAEADYQREKQLLDRFKTQLKETETEAERLEENLDEKIEKLKSDYIEILNHQASMKNETHYLNDRLDGLRQKSGRVDAATQSAKSHTDRVLAEKQAVTVKLRHCAETGRALQQSLTDRQQALQEEEKHCAERKEAVEKISRLIEQAVAKKDTLEALRQDYAGFYQGVRAILKNRGHFEGIYGAVAELIRVDEPYMPAIEIALGASAQNVIVSDERAGRAAIGYLREHKAGRATFLPLSVVKPRKLISGERARIAGDPAFIGTADEMADSQPAYRPAIVHLLGSVVVASDLPGANRLAKLLGYRHRIVTLSGDVIAPGGAMTGGSLKKNQSGPLARNAEIRKIAGQIDEMKTTLVKLQHEYSQLKARIAKDGSETDNLRERVRAAADAYRKWEENLRQAEADEKACREKYELLAREAGDVAAEQQRIEARLTALHKEQAENDKRERELNAAIERLTESRKNRDSEKAKLQSAITTLKVRTAEQGQKVLHFKEKADRFRSRLSELSDSARALETSLRDLHRELDGHSSSDRLLTAQIDKAKENKQQLLESLSKQKERRRALQDRVAGAEKEIKTCRETLADVTSAAQEKNVQLGRMDVRLDHLIDTLREEYRLTFEAAKEDYPLKMDPEKARNEVKRIKREMENLGTVNVGAIDEYKTVHDREQFLCAQRADLVKARTTLENVMHEMDQEVRTRFAKTFAKIRRQFETVFRELFGGGRADLRLIDPDDLLISGIDILAEPPGKKLQRLSLLSGGERALTAIALLFAILKVRPVPFCVLDEVEAALDDANVDRYAAFLKKFSTQTQFIVVTHRHGTMEHADVLYGVTMQESGVTKLVSVRLEDTEALLSIEGK
ncbi:MAG: chromosome segregation protein SMC [Sporolactobacillus sp.]|jgi:chromosome segregation protein|nr:chromosome segregation protein SMC [Sporolactobacillus sp.]